VLRSQVDSRWAHEPGAHVTADLLAAATGGGSADGGRAFNSYGLIRAPWNNVRDDELVSGTLQSFLKKGNLGGGVLVVALFFLWNC